MNFIVGNVENDIAISYDTDTEIQGRDSWENQRLFSYLQLDPKFSNSVPPRLSLIIEFLFKDHVEHL